MTDHEHLRAALNAVWKAARWLQDSNSAQSRDAAALLWTCFRGIDDVYYGNDLVAAEDLGDDTFDALQ